MAIGKLGRRRFIDILKRYEEEFYEMMLSSELMEELITGKRNVLELVVKL